MLTAIEKSTGKKVNTLTDTIENPKGKKWQCHVCQQPLIHVQQSHYGRIEHFRHEQLAEHEFEPETEEHLNGKKFLFEKFQKADKFEMEKNLEFAVPDLYLEAQGKKIAVEFQCSKLPMERLIQRTRNYSNNGVWVLWILGTKNYLQETADRRIVSVSNVERWLQSHYFGRVYYLGRHLFPIRFERYQNSNGRYLKRLKFKNGGNLIERFSLLLTESDGFKVARFLDKKWW